MWVNCQKLHMFVEKVNNNLKASSGTWAVTDRNTWSCLCSWVCVCCKEHIVQINWLSCNRARCAIDSVRSPRPSERVDESQYATSYSLSYIDICSMWKSSELCLDDYFQILNITVIKIIYILYYCIPLTPKKYMYIFLNKYQTWQ